IRSRPPADQTGLRAAHARHVGISRVDFLQLASAPAARIRTAQEDQVRTVVQNAVADAEEPQGLAWNGAGYFRLCQSSPPGTCAHAVVSSNDPGSARQSHAGEFADGARNRRAARSDPRLRKD